jgi:hypothetical protein
MKRGQETSVANRSANTPHLSITNANGKNSVLPKLISRITAATADTIISSLGVRVNQSSNASPMHETAGASRIVLLPLDSGFGEATDSPKLSVLAPR